MFPTRIQANPGQEWLVAWRLHLMWWHQKEAAGVRKRRGSCRPEYRLLQACRQILVQHSGHVYLSGLPVLRTLFQPMPMHKSTSSQNCDFFYFSKVQLYKKNFFIFGHVLSISSKKQIYCLKAKIISLYRVFLLNFTLILRHIK